MDVGVCSPGSPLNPSPPPDRPDCVQGRVCFVFYSHLKNVKEVYVTTTLDRQAQAVRGQVGQVGREPQAAWAEARTLSPTSSHPQVSFYRGAVPEDVPEEAEAARHRKGTDSPWMATLPIKLPVWPGVGGGVCEGGRGGTEAGSGEAGGGRAEGRAHCTPSSSQRLRGSKAPGQGQGTSLSLAPLNLGDAETGFLTQSNLLNVAGRLGPDWPAVALHLGMPYRELQRIRHEFR